MTLENLGRLFVGPAERKRVNEVSVVREEIYRKSAGELVGLLCEISEGVSSPYYKGRSECIDVGCVWVDGFLKKYVPDRQDDNYKVFHTLKIIDADMAVKTLQEKVDIGLVPRKGFRSLNDSLMEAENVLESELGLVLGVNSSNYDNFFNESTSSLVEQARGLRIRCFNEGNFLDNNNMSVYCWCGNLIRPMEIAIRNKYLPPSSESQF